MLRIQVFEAQTTVKFRLEGELIDRTAPLLTEQWAQVRGRLGDRVAILDLGDVVEIDEAGRRTLAWLSNSGVRFGYAGPKLRPILEELACNVPGVPRLTAKIWKRFHLTDCNERWFRPIGYAELFVLFCRLLGAHVVAEQSSWRLSHPDIRQSLCEKPPLTRKYHRGVCDRPVASIALK